MYGEKIYALRKQHRMSRAALGAVFGISSTAVYKWENGLSQPDIPTLIRMADFFGVSLDELCDYTPGEIQNVETTETMVARAVRRMTPEEQEKYLNVGRVLFAHAFAERGAERDGDEDKT